MYALNYKKNHTHTPSNAMYVVANISKICANRDINISLSVLMSGDKLSVYMIF